MYARPKLTDSVSVSELLTMREKGMSNKEIAKSLDVSPATIYAYIGKQPPELHLPCGHAGAIAKREREAYEHQRKEERAAQREANKIWEEQFAALTAEQPVVVSPIPAVAEEEPSINDVKHEKPWDGGLKVISRITHAESADWRYTIDTSNGTVKVSNKITGKCTCVDDQELRNYIDELNGILDLLA